MMKRAKSDRRPYAFSSSLQRTLKFNLNNQIDSILSESEFSEFQNFLKQVFVPGQPIWSCFVLVN